MQVKHMRPAKTKARHLWYTYPAIYMYYKLRAHYCERFVSPCIPQNSPGIPQGSWIREQKAMVLNRPKLVWNGFC